jgi:HEPN domain-containing protein
VDAVVVEAASLRLIGSPPEDYYTDSEAGEAIQFAEKVIAWVRDIWKKLLRKE